MLLHRLSRRPQRLGVTLPALGAFALVSYLVKLPNGRVAALCLPHVGRIFVCLLGRLPVSPLLKAPRPAVKLSVGLSVFDTECTSLRRKSLHPVGLIGSSPVSLRLVYLPTVLVGAVRLSVICVVVILRLLIVVKLRS